MLYHKFVGTSSRCSKGSPVVTHVTQITNDVPLSMAYYLDTWYYPYRHADLIDRGGGGIAHRLDNVQTNVCTSVSSFSNIKKIESYRSGQDTDLWIDNHFPVESKNTTEIIKVTLQNPPQTNPNSAEN